MKNAAGHCHYMTMASIYPPSPTITANQTFFCVRSRSCLSPEQECDSINTPVTMMSFYAGTLESFVAFKHQPNVGVKGVSEQ